MSPTDYRDDELLRRWISGAITSAEEAELERRARQDSILREALESLQDQPTEDHATHVRSMVRKARPTATRRSLFPRYAAAATILILLAAAALLIPRYFTAPEQPIAMEQSQAVSPEESSSPPQVVDPAPPPPSPSVDRPEEKSIPEASQNQLTDQESPVSATESALPPAEMLDEEIASESGEEAPAVRRVAPAPPATLSAPALQAISGASFRIATAPRSVTGRVTNEDGEPIVAAEVYRLGLPTGTTTDSAGGFELAYDATLNKIVVEHPDFEEETVEVFDTTALLQISLTEVAKRARFTPWPETASVSRVPLDADRINRPQARPEEGYRELRERIEANRPDSVAEGKLKVSFLVNEDGSLTDFRFNGQPDRATMDYVGNALVETSTWKVVRGEAPVRVYFTLRFE